MNRNKPIAIACTVVIVAGIPQLVLGMLFWAGIGRGLIPVHETIGSVLVLSLLTLAILAARAGAPVGLVVLVIVWALVLPFVGIGQTDILVGSLHWIIQAIHLLLGLGAMGMASVLAARVPRQVPVGS
ncbi:MAG TPA: hypothetical protein VFX16_36405 [Pseudonocardiaceae bacterium]|nr:hypothetical protein [Pseudonocardiaceae bacterium]